MRVTQQSKWPEKVEEGYLLIVYGQTTFHNNYLYGFYRREINKKFLPCLSFWRFCKHYRICFAIWLFQQPVCMRNRFWCTLRGNISWNNCSISKLPYGKISLTFQEAVSFRWSAMVTSIIETWISALTTDNWEFPSKFAFVEKNNIILRDVNNNNTTLIENRIVHGLKTNLN